MKIEFIHLAKAALVDFRRNKVRTLLTSLGITIGVLAVLMLIAVGIGLQNYLKQTFESLGSNLILIIPGSGFGGEGGAASFGPGIAGGAKFDEKDLKSLEKISETSYVVPASITSSVMEANGKEEMGYAFGTNEQIFLALNLKPITGEKFTKADVSRRAKVVFLGYSLAEKLFDDPKYALDKTVRIKNIRFKIIGVGEKKGDNETDNGAFIPYSTTFGNINGQK